MLGKNALSLKKKSSRQECFSFLLSRASFQFNMRIEGWAISQNLESFNTNGRYEYVKDR